VKSTARRTEGQSSSGAATAEVDRAASIDTLVVRCRLANEYRIAVARLLWASTEWRRQRESVSAEELNRFTEWIVAPAYRRCIELLRAWVKAQEGSRIDQAVPNSITHCPDSIVDTELRQHAVSMARRRLKRDC
jgi:hypothetical protein